MHILIISPLYPSLDYYEDLAEDPATKFLYDYSVEWIKQGHHVQVLQMPATYPRWFNAIAKSTIFAPIAKRLQLDRFTQDLKALRQHEYRHNGIHIYRFPLNKYIPHREYSQHKLRAFARTAQSFFVKHPEKPDLILADYLSPSLTVSTAIQKVASIPIFPIFHQTDIHYLHKHLSYYKPMLEKSDTILCRSYAIAEKCKRAGLHAFSYDYMFSGVPPDIQIGKPRDHVKRFIYCGKLRKSKNVDLVIRAFDCVWQQMRHIELDIVGDGEYALELQALANSMQSKQSIYFTGKLPHDAVFKQMRESDSLVMISKETFGMVYIEAMSQGNIPIAAKGEGIDGIVKDGLNGFLVDINNKEMLTNAMQNLVNATPHNVSQISTNAINTAKEMRQAKLAASLLKKLIRS